MGFLSGGAWVVISGLICRVTIVLSPLKGLMTPLLATHEPPSTIMELSPYKAIIRMAFWDIIP